MLLDCTGWSIMKVINKNVQGIKNLGCPEIVNKDLRVTKEIGFENSDPSLIPFCFCKFANWQTWWTQLQNECEVWKKLQNWGAFITSKIIRLWAMARTPKNRNLSHGSEKFSNPHFWGFEPLLKHTFDMQILTSE